MLHSPLLRQHTGYIKRAFVHLRNKGAFRFYKAALWQQIRLHSSAFMVLFIVFHILIVSAHELALILMLVIPEIALAVVMSFVKLPVKHPAFIMMHHDTLIIIHAYANTLTAETKTQTQLESNRHFH